MASTKISFTPSGAGNRNKWTISLWLKRSKIGVEQVIASAYGDSNNQTQIKFESDDQLYFNDEHGGNTNGRIVSKTKYRDVHSWYHMVFIWDKDNSTNDDKIRMYVNGERVTSFSNTGNVPSAVSEWNSGQLQQFGAKSSSDYFEGLMSHIHFCDGYAYEPTEFGETDSTTGEWKIKTSPSVSYGTNGFFWLKDDVATTDHSPNSNTFTASGSLTKTEDNPSNVFATWNSLVPSGGGYQSQSATHRYGTNDFVSNNSSSNYGTTWSTLGMTTGKYYMEIHYESSSNQGIVGIIGHYPTSTANYIGGHANSYGIYTDGNKYNSGSSSSYGVSWTNGDYLGIFLDLDNNKLYFSKNGTVMNSGTGIDITAASLTEMGAYHFGCMEYNSSGNGDFGANFGNGTFRTTALTGTTYDGADGNGIFKYEPTGLTLDSSTKSFKSLSTKGLNS